MIRNDPFHLEGENLFAIKTIRSGSGGSDRVHPSSLLGVSSSLQGYKPSHLESNIITAAHLIFRNAKTTVLKKSVKPETIGKIEGFLSASC